VSAHHALSSGPCCSPAAHQHGGFADVIGRPNVTEVHAISSWDPTPSFSLRGAWYRFDRRRLDDGAYNR
jgi:hypothetical protein